MNINEAAALLSITRDKLKELIADGMLLPVSKATVKLESSCGWRA